MRRPESARMSFADDVRAGLTAQPKTLPAKYFYDALGSALFEAICQLPEYYLTRAESQVLERRAGDIVGMLGAPVRFVELGSGSATKTRYLIAAALVRQSTLTYHAIDISAAALEASAKSLSIEYPGVVVEGYAADYFEGLKRLAAASNGAVRTLALFLGSNIGNFEPPEAVRLLAALRSALRRGDALLLGADLKKNRSALAAAYDDPLGVTASFNRNVLGRINRELDGHFDLHRFGHRAVVNELESRVEMHLVSQGAQKVAIDALGLSISFDDGESVWTESSYKYDLEQIAALARDGGFALRQTWTDDERRFSCNLLVIE